MDESKRFETLHDPSVPVAEVIDLPLLLGTLREGIAALNDASLSVIVDRDIYVRSLLDLVEEIELEGAVSTLDLLERGALNAVLQRFRFYQDEAQARVSSAGPHTDELARWRPVLASRTQQIQLIERLIRHHR